MVWEADYTDGFNERLLRVMCLNQAIGKLQREIADLTGARDKVIDIIEEGVESEKLEALLSQMRNGPPN